MILPLWFYAVSPWIGIALTLACVAKLIHIDVFPGSARIKAFMRPTVTPPTPAELEEEQAVIAHLRAAGSPTTEQMNQWLSAMETGATHDQRRLAWNNLRDHFNPLKSTPVEPAGAHVETLRQMVGMAGEFRQTLLTVRECIDALTPGHRTGYDWNADPLYMTRYVGDALKAIDAGLKSLNGQAAVPTYRNVYIVTHYPDGGLRGVHASQAGAEAEIAELCREYPDYTRQDFSIVCDRIRPRVWGRVGVSESTGDPCLDEDDRPRRLSRYEQLERLADSGCDTWAEYRGER